MSTPEPKDLFNRELSWLEFNARVLGEAENPDVPLLERLKFLSIVSSNLDEFFMVRVAMARRAFENGTPTVGPDMTRPSDLLSAISHKTHDIVSRQWACLRTAILPGLSERGIVIVRRSEYTKDDRDLLGSLFDDAVAPVLTPLGVERKRGIPLLANCGTYLAFDVATDEAAKGPRFQPEATVVFVQVPSSLKRFVVLPSHGGLRVAVLDDVITEFADRLLRGYRIEGTYACRVTRDADIDVDEEREGDLLAAVEDEVRSRRMGHPVRLEVDEGASDAFTATLVGALGLSKDDIYVSGNLLDLASFGKLVGIVNDPELADAPWPPHPHPAFATHEEGRLTFDALRDRDILLHHPYHSFDPVVQLLQTAAVDPDVLAIKMTLYRVSGDSPIVRALIAAAKNGKQVTVLVELRARFDEEANVHWARGLGEAGAHVVYAVVGYKTHGKALLVVRRESDGLRRYVHLSTGNYNDKTARLYTDLGLLTTRKEFGADVSAFFNVITGYSMPPKWNVIEIAPTGLRRRMTALIEREIEKHAPETPGLIRAKVNSLIDPGIISALYDASRAGVHVDLVVRGMCRLRPGIEGLSKNIRVRSVIDRFLEHSRIYHFRNGGSDEVYLSSADLMERNLDRRLEVLFPLVDDGARQSALRIVDAALDDNTKAWRLDADGTYSRVPRRGRKRRRSQADLYEEAGRAVATRPAHVTDVFRVRRAPSHDSQSTGSAG